MSALSFPGGTVDTSAMREAHNGPTPTTLLNVQTLLEMADSALGRAMDAGPGSYRRDKILLAIDWLNAALEEGRQG